MQDKKNVENKSIGMPARKKFIYPHIGIQVEAESEAEARVMADGQAKVKEIKLTRNPQ